MPDNNIFDILIRFGLDKQKAQEAAAEVRKLGEETAKTGAAGVKAEKEVEEATQKTFTSKKQLKDMLKQIGHEFPILGQLGQLALNPLAISAAAMTAAFAVLREKLKETQVEIGKAKWGTEEINAAAEGYSKFAEQMVKAADASGTLATNLQKIFTYQKLIETLGKTAGKDPNDNPLWARKQAETKAAEQRAAAAANRAQAADLRNQAARTDAKGTALTDQNTQVALDDDAAKAAAQIADLDKEIASINEAYEPGNEGLGRYTADHIKFATKYGAFTKPEEMVAALKEQRAGYQRSIDVARANKRKNETNQERRKGAAAMRARADELDKSASEMETQATEGAFQGQVEFYRSAKAQGYQPVVTPTGRGYSVTPQVKGYFDQANAALEEIGKEWNRAINGMLAQAKATADQAATAQRRTQ